MNVFAAALFFAIVPYQSTVTSPEKFFGHPVGADYYLSNYAQMSEYWRLLESQSDRLRLQVIGKTSEGRDQLMAIVTAPENFRRIEEYKNISRQLCLANGLSESEARELAKTGKAVVWIDGGLHATETLGAQQLIETVYRLLSSGDEETLRILENVIVLFVHANPDGMDLVSDWYMREQDPTKRAFNIPRLYQNYIGHDNNRDFYAVTQVETKNMCRIMYREWFPQIVYNHHQTGPAGTVMFAPPFRDPFNHFIDPGVMSGIDFVAAAMMQRFISMDMPGVTTKTGAQYSAWWNGGLRTTSYFHNMIGILTETIGSPTPTRIPFVASRRTPKGTLLYPIEPQEWKFRDSVEYSVQANLAILDLASRHREQFLMNICRMGRRQIENGSRDTWLDFPSRVENANSMRDIRKPELRNPRGYIISSDQPEFPNALRFAQALMETGVEVLRATSPFVIEGIEYPADSLIVRCDQAFRPHVLDMFEPQDHPNDIPAPGAPPVPPYDVAGYTPALQMGFRFVRVLDGFDGPFAEVPFPIDLNSLRPTFDPTITWSYRDAFAKLRDKHRVRLGQATVTRSPRIALLDRYGGSMPSGWIRWIFDQFEIEHRVVYPRDLDTEHLSEAFDTIVLPSGMVPATLRDTAPQDRAPGDDQLGQTATIPPEFQHMVGNVSERSVRGLRTFVENGGTLIAIGTSCSIARHFGLPIEDVLAPGGRSMPRNVFYVPGSLLEIQIDTSFDVATGMNENAIVMFANNSAFRITDDQVKAIATYASPNPLRSGWILGPEHIRGQLALAEAKVGKGTIYLFAPEITFRGQSWGTFRLLFNAILLSVT